MSNNSYNPTTITIDDEDEDDVMTDTGASNASDDDDYYRAGHEQTQPKQNTITPSSNNSNNDDDNDGTANPQDENAPTKVLNGAAVQDKIDIDERHQTQSSNHNDTNETIHLFSTPPNKGNDDYDNDYDVHDDCDEKEHGDTFNTVVALSSISENEHNVISSDKMMTAQETNENEDLIYHPNDDTARSKSRQPQPQDHNVATTRLLRSRDKRSLVVTRAVRISSNEDDDYNDDGNTKSLMEFQMPDDAYTLVFAYSACQTSIGWYGVFLMGVQFAIIAMLYKDLLRNATPENKLAIPVRTPMELRIAQFMSLPFAFLCHDKCRKSLLTLFSSEYNPNIQIKFPYATRTSWMISQMLRFSVGILLIFVSLIQLMQATTITDLFLNLDATVFLGQIDHIGFWFAQRNFISQTFTIQCEKALTIVLMEKRGRKYTDIRRIGALLAFCTLVAGWSVIVKGQNTNQYLETAACKSFAVTFGDYTLDLDPTKINVEESVLRNYSSIWFSDDWSLYMGEDNVYEMLYSAFSGTYSIGRDNETGNLITWSENDDSSGLGSIMGRGNDRPVYYEQSEGYPLGFQDPSLGYFFYCGGTWIFKVDALENAFGRNVETDELGCGRWLLRSPGTKAYRLEEVSPEGWRIWTGKVEVARDFHFACVDCKTSLDCNYHGSCNTDSNTCDCETGRLGTTCGFESPCDRVQLSYIGEDSWDYEIYAEFFLVGKDGNVVLGDGEELLILYDRPAYVSWYNFDIGIYMYYLGSRWVIEAWDYGNFSEWFLDEEYPAHTFWDMLSQGSSIAVSEPTQNGDPFGLKWRYVGESRSRGDYGPYYYTTDWNVAVRCVTNDCSRLCGEYGNCTTIGCVCANCYGGYYCENDPSEDYARDQFLTWFQEGSAQVEGSQYYEKFWKDKDILVDCSVELEYALSYNDSVSYNVSVSYDASLFYNNESLSFNESSSRRLPFVFGNPEVEPITFNWENVLRLSHKRKQQRRT